MLTDRSQSGGKSCHVHRSGTRYVSQWQEVCSEGVSWRRRRNLATGKKLLLWRVNPEIFRRRCRKHTWEDLKLYIKVLAIGRNSVAAPRRKRHIVYWGAQGDLRLGSWCDGKERAVSPSSCIRHWCLARLIKPFNLYLPQLTQRGTNDGV